MNDSAIYYYTLAGKSANTTTENSIAILSNLSIAYLNKNDYTKSKALIYKAINISNKSKFPSKLISSSIYNNIALSEFHAKNYDTVIKYTKRSIAANTISQNIQILVPQSEDTYHL